MQTLRLLSNLLSGLHIALREESHLSKHGKTKHLYPSKSTSRMITIQRESITSSAGVFSSRPSQPARHHSRPFSLALSFVAMK